MTKTAVEQEGILAGIFKLLFHSEQEYIFFLQNYYWRTGMPLTAWRPTAPAASSAPKAAPTATQRLGLGSRGVPGPEALRGSWGRLTQHRTPAASRHSRSN